MNRKRNGFGESKQLLAEEVYHHIATRIVEGDYPPGHRIRDVDVAEELHVSRTPVREALQRLERLGLVTMYPSRFTEVTAVTPEIVEQSLEFAGYQAGVSARMAVARMTQAQREHVAGLVEKMYAAVDDATLISQTRWAVFSYLSDHSRNAQQRVLVQDSGMALFRNLHEWTVPEADRSRMQQIYRDFREAVLQGDADGAERLARDMHYV
jgi:DNA-binding GntR family transcriptional regulator